MIINHGNLAAWLSPSATATTMTVVNVNDAKILNGSRRALDRYEFVFRRQMGLTDAHPCASPLSILYRQWLIYLSQA